MGAIIDGVYYPRATVNSLLHAKQQSTWKQHDHDRQRRDHAMELIQPYNRDGTVNDKFIEAMPEEARRYGFLPNDDTLKELK